MITKATLHYTILKAIIEKGFAPNVTDLAEILDTDKTNITKGLYELQDYHGLVLHPNEPKIWVIHPFSLAPTNFYVTSKKGEWWGNCAWCSLGIAALLQEDVEISTIIGGERKQVTIHILDGAIQEKNYYVHFPISMKNAWDNVIYTCSNMLLFENEKQVNSWSEKHNIPKGDVQPIEKIWAFSKKWYGNHLNPNWEKWTIAEAKAMFAAFNLDHKIWHLEDSKEHF